MMKNNKLFNYINPKNNDILSKMNGKELQDLIFYLDYILNPLSCS